MRRCKFCGKESYIMLRSPRMALCEEHFVRYFERKVERVIKRHKMFPESAKILIALSGGKDAIAAAIALKNLGYEYECLHINLGIPGYSEESEEVVKKQCEIVGGKLHVVRLKELVGEGIGERKRGRQPCSYCGMTKRYLMNKFAVDNGFDVVVTGHNLDDETAFLLGNLIHWNVDYLGRQGPYLPKGLKLAARAKPLYELTNYEIRKYVDLFNVPVVESKCPFSRGAKSILYAKVLDEIESESPGTKINFVKGFLKNRALFEREEEIELKECRVCGMPTVGDVCSFCRFWNLSEGVDLRVR